MDNAKAIVRNPDLDVCQNFLVFTFEAPCSNQMGGRSGRPGETGANFDADTFSLRRLLERGS